MTMTITGNDADFDPTVTFTETAPASGDAVTAASLSSNGSTPKTGFQAEANAIEFFREVFRGNLTALKVLFDGAGNATPPTWSGAIPLIGTSDNAGGANPALALGMRDTTAGAAQVRFYRGASALYITMNAYWDAAASKWTADAAGVISYALEVSNSGVVISQKAAGSAPWAVWDGGDISLRDVNATRDVNAGRKLTAATDRSSATPGAGQSLAAGEIYRDTVNFCAGRFVLDNGAPPAPVVDRSFNVASIARISAGRYEVTVQTAAAHYLIPQAIVFDLNGTYSAMIDFNLNPPTTSTFEIITLDATTGLAADVSVNGDGGVFFSAIAL